MSGGHIVGAFAAGDGSRRWDTEVGGALNPFIEPAVDTRSVLVSAGDRFVLLDRANGGVLWEAPAGGDATGVALVASGRDATVAVTEVGRGELTGRDASTGALRWTVAREGRLDTHPAGDATTATVVAVWQAAGVATVRAIDVASGAPRWEQRVEALAASPVVAGHVVVIAAGDGDYGASVRALRLADGALRWRTPVPGSFEPDQVPGVDTTRGHAVVGVQDHLGNVSLLDLATGVVRWRVDTRVPALGGRVLLTAQHVVVRNEGQQLVILDRARGRILGRRSDPAGLPEGIDSVGDRVFVGWRRTDPGRIDALEIEIPGAAGGKNHPEP